MFHNAFRSNEVMNTKTRLYAAVALLFLLAGCGETTGSPDASREADAGSVDTFEPDPDTRSDVGVDTVEQKDTTEADVTLRACNRVVFEYEAPNAKSVWVTGTFTDWAKTPSEGAIEMSKSGDGTWSVETTIRMEGRHQYKFIVDGDKWVTDPDNPNRADDGEGGKNSVLRVCKGGSMTHDPCQEVTFEWQGSADSVWVSGTFTGWAENPSKGALTLTQTSKDVWTLETVISPKGRHLYKFIIDGKQWIADPDNPKKVDDGVGGKNSVLEVCNDDPVGGQCDPKEYDWRDTVMYFAMVDRFRDSDGMADPVPGVSDGDATKGPSGQYEGGDLEGVTNKLNYLSKLGVSALWLSAPYENRDVAGAAINPGADSHTYSAYHGYWPSPADIDYSNPKNPTPTPKVESRIGDAQDLKNLVKKAHGLTTKNGAEMKVLFDYVMNHVDDESGLYKAHPGWFARKNGQIATCGGQNLWEDPYWGTRCAFTKYLPPLDLHKKAPRDWSVNDAMWWAREFDIDGYRLDAIKHVPLKWLTQLRSRLNSEFPSDERFYLVGETFNYDNRKKLKKYVDSKTMLDGQFDFPFKARLCEALFRPNGRLDAFSSWLDGNQGYYGSDAIMTTWIGNHDIPRAIHFASGQISNCRAGSSPQNGWNPSSYRQPTQAAPYERLGLAFAVMMTTNAGIPLIYYGDEVGLAGGGDPDNRRMMPWKDTRLNSHQKALRKKVRTLAGLRGEHPVLARGRRSTLSMGQDTWVYRMSGCGSKPIIVAINRADSQNSVQLPKGTYEDLRKGASAMGGSVSIPARDFVIFKEK